MAYGPIKTEHGGRYDYWSSREELKKDIKRTSTRMRRLNDRRIVREETNECA